MFLSLMRKKYHSTFYSMETGTEWIQSVVILGENDRIKQEIFDCNPAKWKAIEPQVKEWVGEGWMGWERDKPDWFTDNWKAKVPADWVPKEGKAEHERVKESERRRSIAGSARKGSVMYESAKKLVNVMGSDGGGEVPEARVGEGGEQASAEAVRGGSRVQPVIR